MSLQLLRETPPPAFLMPREKMEQFGVDALSDAELLSVLLGTGYKGLGVADLSNHLLSRFGNRGLFQFRSLDQIRRETELPFVKSCLLLALSEMVRRLTLRDESQLKSPQQVYEYMRAECARSTFEKLYVICVDHQRRVLFCGPVAQGKPNTVQVSLAAVLHHPIRLNSQNIYLVHNHPRGEVRPSPEDLEFTRLVEREVRTFGITLDDHLILGEDAFFSFAQESLLGK